MAFSKMSWKLDEDAVSVGGSEDEPGSGGRFMMREWSRRDAHVLSRPRFGRGNIEVQFRKGAIDARAT